MRTYALENRGRAPLYEYLYRCIRGDILDGTLTAGERLPSKRALAEHLHISVMTVEGAYQQLEAEGYVYTQPKRGFLWRRWSGPGLPSPAPPAPEAPPEAPVWRLDLKSNQVDASRFPAAAWARLTRQVLSEDGEALLRPVPHQGLPALRQAIARDLREYKGMAVPPEQIVVGAGAEYLYLLLAQLLGREAVFAVEDPGYPKIRQVYGKCGAACRPVPLDGQGVPPEALEAAGASVVHLSPAHHYPTGLVTPIGRRQALLRWAEKAGGIIIEDDYDSEFRFTGRPIPTLQSIDTAGRVVYMNTFSQTISPLHAGGIHGAAAPPAGAVPPGAGFLFLHGARPGPARAGPVPGPGPLRAAPGPDAQGVPHPSRRGSGLLPVQPLPEPDHDLGAGGGAPLSPAAGHPGERRGPAGPGCGPGRPAGLSLGVRRHPSPAYAHTLVVNYAGLSPAALPEAMDLLAEIFGA